MSQRPILSLAEGQKRGKDFWSEFELYVVDLLVGVVVDVVLVCMLEPFVRFGQPTRAAGLRGTVNHAIGALPSSVLKLRCLVGGFPFNNELAHIFTRVFNMEQLVLDVELLVRELLIQS